MKCKKCGLALKEDAVSCVRCCEPTKGHEVTEEYPGVILTPEDTGSTAEKVKDWALRVFVNAIIRSLFR